MSDLSVQPEKTVEKSASAVLVWIVGLVFFLSSGMWIYPYSDEAAANFGTVFIGRIYYNSMLLIILLTLAVYYRKLPALLLRYSLLAVLIGVFALSLFVSIEPKETFLFVIRIFLFISFFIVAASQLSLRQIIKMLTIFFIVSSFRNAGITPNFRYFFLQEGVHYVF